MQKRYTLYITVFKWKRYMSQQFSYLYLSVFSLESKFLIAHILLYHNDCLIINIFLHYSYQEAKQILS